MTRKIKAGLIGAHIENSKFGVSLAMVAEAHGIAVEFEHIDTADQPDFDFAATVRGLIEAGWSGVTVTHPWKIDAMALADRRRNAPDTLASANTLLFRDVIEATNTDYTGFRAMWAEAMGGAAPGRVAMAGAGGVARSIAAALSEAGAEDIAVWDLTPGAADRLASEIGGAVRAVAPEEAVNLIAAANGLVNATPLGMAAHTGAAFEGAALGPQNWLFDAVYAPAPTLQARLAAAAGLMCLTGHDLFRHMLLGSFEFYTGVTPDAAAMLPKLKTLSEGRA